MSDLSYIQQTQEVKIVGQDSTGNNSNYVSADTNGNLQVKDYSVGPVTPGAVASGSSLSGGQFNTALPTLTNTQQSAIQLDSNGKLIIRSLTSTDTVNVNNLPITVDTNFGTVGASTIRTASHIGNTTGDAAFGTGSTTSQVLRTVLVTDQTGINTFQDKSGTGTITSLNGTVTATTNGAATVVFAVTGTFVATLFFKGIRQDGTGEYLYANFIQFGGDVSEQSTTGVGTYIVNCAGFATVTVKAESFTSGTVTVGWNASNGTNLVKVYQPAASNLQTTARVNDGLGNSITSSPVTGTTTSKQPIDIHEITTATGYYTTSFSIQQSAASAANSTVFSMRNVAGSTRTVYINRIMLNMFFNASTPITRTSQQYIFQRFSAATPTGGTALSAGQMDSSDAASQVTDIRFLDTGLTTTGVTFDTKTIGSVVCPTFGTVTVPYERQDVSIKLAPGEGFCIRVGNTAVIGQGIGGEIIWSER